MKSRHKVLDAGTLGSTGRAGEPIKDSYDRWMAWAPPFTWGSSIAHEV